MAISFVFINSFLRMGFNQKNKRRKLRTDSAAPSGGHGKPTHFTHLPWFPLKAQRSIPTFFFYLPFSADPFTFQFANQKYK
jgi:hypothetical protein